MGTSSEMGRLEERDFKEIYGDKAIDATESVEVYEKGKTMECPNCGAGTGVEKNTKMWKCYDCNHFLVDLEYDSREGQGTDRQDDGGQMELGDFA